MRTRALRGIALAGVTAATLASCTVDPMRWNGGATNGDMAGAADLAMSQPDLAMSRPDLATPDLATPDMTTPIPLISGTFADRQYLPTGTGNGTTMDRPRDLTNVPVEVYVLDNTGTYKAPVAGQGSANGTFSVSNIPDGARYALRVGTRWVAGTTLRSHALGDEILGRADGGLLTSANVGLTVTATNMFAAAITDNFAIFSPTLDASFNDLINNVTDDTIGNLPFEGDTSITDVAFRLTVLRPQALRYNNDTVFFTQLVRDLNAPIIYSTVPRVIGPVSLTAADAADAGKLMGAFTTVPQNQTIASLAWQRAAFDTAAKAMHPTQTDLRRINMSVIATPGGYVRREWPYTPALLEATAATDVGGIDTADAATGVLTYGNPYPAAWGLIGVAETAVNFKLANNPDGAVKGVGFIVYLADLDTFKSRAIGPLVTPVRNLQINSPALGAPKNAQAAQTAVGTDPTLTWQAPSAGSPDRYRITLMKSNKGATRDQVLAVFDTTETQLAVPPGLLTVGQPVYFIIRAQQKVGPITAGVPQGWADAFTDIITP